ncbi:MAG: PepSY domain-containing protein [Burkholderiales bacterium]|nr:PepSY domain-containing protein [Burkholderiales bacterium]
MHRSTRLSLVAVATCAVALGAWAAAGGLANDALAIKDAKIALAQAVSIAEQHANGKASKAEYERSKKGARYEVEVVSGDKVFDVTVDADKGTVLTSVEDQADHGDGER